MSAFLFCTTPLATLEVVREFFQITRETFELKERRNGIWADPFIPARRDPQQTPGPSKEPLEFVVDLFDDLSESQLRDLFQESYSTINGFMPGEAFAVLDERGVREKTVVIHAWAPAIEDNEVDTWYSWRVRFEVAEQTIYGIIGSVGVFRGLFIQNSDKFIGEDGIFDYQSAQDAWDAGSLQYSGDDE